MSSDPKGKEAEVRVYNRSTNQTFDHGTHKVSPSSFATVPQAVADVWFRLFPNVVIDAGAAQKELGGAQVELGVLRSELAKCREQLAASQARVEELLEQLHPAKPIKKHVGKEQI